MTAEYTTHYASMENELTGLLQTVLQWLPPRNFAAAREFIAAREYGLALETISEGLRETGHVAPFIDLILKLAREMEIGNEPFVKALTR